MIPLPEGQVLVICPYCEMRSFVQGERGVRRFQVPQRVPRQAAIEAMHRFFASHLAIARGLKDKAEISETFLVYLPFWTVWGRVAGWAFGQKRISSGKNTRYEPREVRIVQEMNWTSAACDVGEFGVNQIVLSNQQLDPYHPDTLHQAGLVFEPINSFQEALKAAEQQFEQQIQDKAGLERISQIFMRLFRHRTGCVYYPLWVLRYSYRGRTYQVVVDGYSGDLLYGKAPGNTFYRAAMLVGGMALGAFLAIDVNAALLYAAADSDDSDGLFYLAIALLLGGGGLMIGGYRAFRYGEQYEYRRFKARGKSIGFAGFNLPSEVASGIKELESWVSKFS
jgi:hypothetical protein